MRLAMDVRKYFDFGIGTYIRNLVDYLKRQPGESLELITAPDQEKELAVELKIPVHANRSGKYSVSELLSVSHQVNGLSVDLFHAPHYTLPYGLRVPSVVTIHDLIHLRFPEHFSFAQRTYARVVMNHACRTAKAVIVDAEFTKTDIISTFEIPHERIHVIPLGVAPAFRPAASVAEGRAEFVSMGFVEPYVLYAGGLKPHKNVATLLKAFAQFRYRDSARLVISGENLWVNASLAQLSEDLGIKRRILSLPMNPQRLVRLYQGATVVVMPSLYEGFGLPIVEAMACGAPVIGARAASIPEVIGEGGLLFDPLSVDELVQMMERVFDDPGLQQSQREYGLRRASRYSWDRCGASTLRLYRSVAGKENT